jgi:hypothetical protein
VVEPESQVGAGGDEVGEDHRLVAVGTETTEAQSVSEAIAIGTAVVAEHAAPAGRAFVDGLPFRLTDRQGV